MKKIRVVSRKSNLALIQVNELMNKMHIDQNRDYELITLDSHGDKNKKISLMDSPIKDIFTKELDTVILNGEGDIAIHSAKDLPFPLHPDLELIALIPPFDQTDSLVSRNSIKLKDLPKGSKIGTSSPQRQAQILDRNPGLEIISIRGTIEERIKQVDDGIVDSLIVATCALKRLGLENRITEVLDFDTHPLQGFLAVTSKRNNLSVRNLFSELDILKTYGSVDLIGFGPGNPDLLTIKADKILRSADVIFYDALIPGNFLDSYPGQKEYVGKRKNCHSYSQEDICQKLYLAAVDGKKVVRLKGGDPFIFGRGGEESDYLESRLIKVTTTPGITAAQGAASSINVPLTKRGVSRELSLYTAHKGELDSSSKTHVFYMGGTKLTEIQNKLLKMGEMGDTPVLLIENATLDSQFEIKTTIKTMHLERPNLPVIVISGGVSKDYTPKKYIWNTGLRDKDYGLKGRVIHKPLIQIVNQDIEVDINQYDTVLFTSITAVKHFTQNIDIKGKKIISIGSGTTRALNKIGLEVNYESTKPDSDTLYNELLSMKLTNRGFTNILYPCSKKSDNELQKLENVESLPIYTTENVEQDELLKINLDRVEGIIFTSPSTVDSFVLNYKEIPNVDIFCFGKFTEARISYYKEGLYVQTISL